MRLGIQFNSRVTESDDKQKLLPLFHSFNGRDFNELWYEYFRESFFSEPNKKFRPGCVTFSLFNAYAMLRAQQNPNISREALWNNVIKPRFFEFLDRANEMVAYLREWTSTLDGMHPLYPNLNNYIEVFSTGGAYPGGSFVGENQEVFYRAVSDVLRIEVIPAKNLEELPNDTIILVSGATIRQRRYYIPEENSDRISITGEGHTVSGAIHEGHLYFTDTALSYFGGKLEPIPFKILNGLTASSVASRNLSRSVSGPLSIRGQQFDYEIIEVLDRLGLFPLYQVRASSIQKESDKDQGGSPVLLEEVYLYAMNRMVFNGLPIILAHARDYNQLYTGKKLEIPIGGIFIVRLKNKDIIPNT